MEETAAIEAVCFPEDVAESKENLITRMKTAPDLYLVAVERSTRRVAAYLNGADTKEQSFRDEFFTDLSMYDPGGENVFLLGLAVLPEYRGRGIARALMEGYVQRQKVAGRKSLHLTCLSGKISMYENMGFALLGRADSSWGGEEWFEMIYDLTK